MGDYFKPSEFACRCGCGTTIVNPELLSLLNQAREAFGRPIVIASGTRCPKHNAEVGGSQTSEHLTGHAADVRCLADDTRWALLKIFFALGVKRIEVAPTWLHIGVSRTHPQKVCFLPKSQ